MTKSYVADDCSIHRQNGRGDETKKDHDLFAGKVHYFDFVVMLTFDLLTSKFDQFIFVPNCTEIVNLVKFTEAVYRISC